MQITGTRFRFYQYSIVDLSSRLLISVLDFRSQFFTSVLDYWSQFSIFYLNSLPQLSIIDLSSRLSISIVYRSCWLWWSLYLIFQPSSYRLSVSGLTVGPGCSASKLRWKFKGLSVGAKVQVRMRTGMVKSTHAQLNTGLDRDGNVQLRWRGGETSNLKERTSRQTKCNEREKLYVFCRRFPCHRSPILLTRKRVHRVNAPAPVPALRAAAAAHLVRLQVVSDHFI